MMTIFKYFMVMAVTLLTAEGYRNAMFYCGFGDTFCGQSKTNDVYSSIDTVIMAFANTIPGGKAIVDELNFPWVIVNEWRKSGKTVIISVGGENGKWSYVFANDNSINNFVESLASIVQKYGLDGVDLDIESYDTAPRTVISTIIKLRQRLNQIGRKLIILSPANTGVYQGAPVPSPDAVGHVLNYYVPIIN